jgi:DNA-binding transcriptional regulator YiaG
MTADEFKANRISLGLTQSQAATVFGVGKRTLEYWETDDGKRPVHPTAIKFMQWLLTGARPPWWPK